MLFHNKWFIQAEVIAYGIRNRSQDIETIWKELFCYKILSLQPFYMVLSGELRFNNVWDTLNRWNKVYSLYSTSGVDGYVYDLR